MCICRLTHIKAAWAGYHDSLKPAICYIEKVVSTMVSVNNHRKAVRITFSTFKSYGADTL
jgi:hypothetical protein